MEFLRDLSGIKDGSIPEFRLFGQDSNGDFTVQLKVPAKSSEKPHLKTDLNEAHLQQIIRLVQMEIERAEVLNLDKRSN